MPTSLSTDVAAAAGKDMSEATCLFTGKSSQAEGVSPLVITHAPSEENTHTIMLRAGAKGSLVKQLKIPAETLAHQHGCSPDAIDLLGFTGIKMHGATTTFKEPVGITFSSTNPTTGEFTPLKTVTRACFQSATHGDQYDAGHMCHFIANPSSVGFVHPPMTIRLHKEQTADNMATNLCLRQMRWPKMNMTPTDGYATATSMKHGEMSAIPMNAPAKCNVSYLLQTNPEKLTEIAGPHAKMIESTSGKFAMIPTSSLTSIKEKLSASFKKTSIFHGGLTATAFSLSGNPMPPDTVTTMTFGLVKNPQSIAERAANALDDTHAPMAVERIHKEHIGGYLGEGAAAPTTAVLKPVTHVELKSELETLLND